MTTMSGFIIGMIFGGGLVAVAWYKVEMFRRQPRTKKPAVINARWK